MLKRDRDKRQYGIARDQRLADDTSVRRNVAQHSEAYQQSGIDNAFAVTVSHPGGEWDLCPTGVEGFSRCSVCSWFARDYTVFGSSR